MTSIREFLEWTLLLCYNLSLLPEIEVLINSQFVHTFLLRFPLLS